MFERVDIALSTRGDRVNSDVVSLFRLTDGRVTYGWDVVLSSSDVGFWFRVDLRNTIYRMGNFMHTLYNYLHLYDVLYFYRLYLVGLRNKVGAAGFVWFIRPMEM